MDSITLKNNIPIIGYKSVELLSKSEQKLAKFFKCCSNEWLDPSYGSKKCFFSTNSDNSFKEHLTSKHSNVFCIYCDFDNKTNDSKANTECKKSFGSEDWHQLIDHMVQSHGTRTYQCNKCQYRAYTSTHIQLHQISVHYDIWTNNNSIISYESLEDPNQNVCRIIVCKSISMAPKVDHSVWIPNFCPNSASDLAENKYFCLFCEHTNEEAIHVFLHCVRSHPDLQICVYRKESQNTYSFDSYNESPNTISSNSEDNDVIEVADNVSKPLAKSFTTQCTVNCEPTIPGLGDRFRPPKRKHSYHSYDNHFEDELPDYGEYREHRVHREPIAPKYHKPYIPPPKPFHQKFSHSNNKFNKNQIQRPTIGGYKEHRLNNAIKGQRQPSATNPNPSASRGQPSHLGSELPPEIDLHSIESELGLESTDSLIRNNSFKTIKRVGLSVDKQTNKAIKISTKPLTKPLAKPFTYIPREEEKRDEYLELLNETPIPKKGIKARFENHKHFELMPLQSTSSTFGDKNSYKCLLCSDEMRIKQNNIRIHLKSVHKTDSSLKCGYCDHIGQKPALIEHSKLKHPNADLKIEKFIVHCTQNSAIGFTSGTHLEKAKTTARKSTTAGPIRVTKGGKGALTQRIRESTFMGPLRNDRTDGKRTSESEVHQQFQRVYNRTTHSSNIMHKKRRLNVESDSESEAQMDSDIESDVYMLSDTETIAPEPPVGPKTKLISVAKKSTAKASSEPQNETQIVITLTEEQIPNKYFCVFCSEGFIINDKREAIEHYKGHLDLCYTCNLCHYSCVSYASMEHHWKSVHKSEDMDTADNFTAVIQNWILTLLDNQIKISDLIESSPVVGTGVNIFCPLCVKAAKICNLSARPFNSLWKAKLHICKHLLWCPMHCNLCEQSVTVFPHNPYLLMKHLVDFHFTSCENLYNISFRGQKPFNDMKREQLRLIDKNFTSIQVPASDIISSFFNQLMTELDLNYENQLKSKFRLTKEIRVNLKRCIQIKSEPNDPIDLGQESEAIDAHHMKDEKEDKKDIKDIKDIKHLIKSEIKTEIKSEIKSEVKTEIKDELKNELKDEVKDEEMASEQQILSELYGEPESSVTVQSNPTPGPKHSIILDEIILSSDDES